MKTKFTIKQLKLEQGNALITLLFFMVIAITVISATTLVISANLLATSATEQGLSAYYVAESGAENGILYLLRNPSYTGTLPIIEIGTGQATINITGGTIVSTGSDGKSIRKIQIQTSNTNGLVKINSWKEIY